MLRVCCTLLVLGAVIGAEAGLPWSEFVLEGAPAMSRLEELPDSTARKIVGSALDTLYALGGAEMVFCEMQRLEAPLEGWLLDGIFFLSSDEGDFSTFRVGVDAAGKAFVIICRGVDSDGNVRWLPAPGPEHVPTADEAFPEEVLSYEYLIGRDEFESLQERYRL